MKRIDVEEKLKSMGLEVFTPLEFRRIFGVSSNTASFFISSNIHSGLFVKLRNNYYTLKDSNPSQFLIANKMYQPSYISLTTALSHYGIIPEVVYATTSVTTKISREYITPKGAFIYQRIKTQAFTGYGLTLIDKDNILIAAPAKALADYLYFVDLQRVSLNDRLDLKNIVKSDLIAFVKLFDRPSMLKLVNDIYAAYKKPRKFTDQAQTSLENVVREYCQHLFLSYLYQQPRSEQLLFKGDTALRIVFHSPRFSEDLDFTGINIHHREVEEIFTNTLVALERTGISVELEEGKPTTGGFLGIAVFHAYDNFIKVKVEVSLRNGKGVKGCTVAEFQLPFVD